MPWWIWILLGFFLLLVELLTPGGLYLLFFGVAAVLVGLLGGVQLSGPPWMQWLLFSILSIAALALLRRRLLGKLRPAQQSREVDSLVGETALSLEDIAVDGIGKAELRGTAWNARNVGTSTLTRGQRCKVERVEGLMLWVRG
jgi:inner membrane protein